MQVLLHRGCKIHSLNADGQNVLMAALKIDHAETRMKIIEYLISKGASSDFIQQTTGWSLLMHCCRLKRTDVAEYLLKETRGSIDVLHRDNQGRIALHHAVISNSRHILQVLLKHHKYYHLPIDVHDCEGMSPYLYSCRLYKPHLSQLLLQAGASAQQVDHQRKASANTWLRNGKQEKIQRQLTDLAAQVGLHTA